MATSRSARVRLEAQHRIVSGRIAGLTREVAEIVESAQLANVDDEHDPEGSTIAYERAKVLALLATAQQDLVAIDAALRRTDDATYGMCLTCGRPISPDRLDAVPATTTCIACAHG